MPDDAVRNATGRDLSEWFEELDTWDVAGKGDRAAIDVLKREYRLAGVWAETIAGEYVRASAARAVADATAPGDLVVSQTWPLPGSFVWTRIAEADACQRWLGAESLVVLKVGDSWDLEDGSTVDLQAMDHPRAMRFGWELWDGKRANVTLELRAEGPARTAVRLIARDAPDEGAEEELREGLTLCLERIGDLLD